LRSWKEGNGSSKAKATLHKFRVTAEVYIISGWPRINLSFNDRLLKVLPKDNSYGFTRQQIRNVSLELQISTSNRVAAYQMAYMDQRKPSS